MQRAVDAVPDADPVGVRLDVDVGRPVAQRLREQDAVLRRAVQRQVCLLYTSDAADE